MGFQFIPENEYQPDGVYKQVDLQYRGNQIHYLVRVDDIDLILAAKLNDTTTNPPIAFRKICDVIRYEEQNGMLVTPTKNSRTLSRIARQINSNKSMKPLKKVLEDFCNRD